MSAEITLTASLSALRSAIMSSAVGRSISGATFNMAGNFFSEQTILVGTAATVIPLGQVTAPHWSVFHNFDATNFIKLRNGSGGTDVVQLLAGEWAFFPWLTTSTPYAIADTAACVMEYLILSL